jgi:hypothetical protein
MGIDASGKPMLIVDLSGISGNGASDPALSMRIAGFGAATTYHANAVWAADGATDVLFDSDRSKSIAQERFVATAGSITVSAASSANVTGTVNAQLKPEAGGSDLLNIAGSWACDIA